MKEKVITIAHSVWETLRRILLAILSGVVIGGVGILFVKALGFAENLDVHRLKSP